MEGTLAGGKGTVLRAMSAQLVGLGCAPPLPVQFVDAGTGGCKSFSFSQPFAGAAGRDGRGWDDAAVRSVFLCIHLEANYPEPKNLRMV